MPAARESLAEERPRGARDQSTAGLAPLHPQLVSFDPIRLEMADLLLNLATDREAGTLDAIKKIFHFVPTAPTPELFAQFF